MPVTPSSVVMRRVTKLRDGLVTNTSAAMIFTADPFGNFRSGGGALNYWPAGLLVSAGSLAAAEVLPAAEVVA